MPIARAARRAGLDNSYWGKLEKGRCDPTLTSLLKIQRAFGLDSLETLLGPTASSKFLEILGTCSGSGGAPPRTGDAGTRKQ